MKQGRMGERQRWAWIVAGISAAVAAKGCGLGWVWVLAGGIAAAIYYINIEHRQRSCGLAVQMAAAWGKWILVPVLLWTITAMAWTAVLADGAFPMIDGFPSLGWVLLLLAAVGCRKGAGACAACAGVLCLLLLPLYGTVAGFSLPEADLTMLKPYGHWTNGMAALGLFLLPAAVWFLPSRRRKKAMWKEMLLLPVIGAIPAAVTAAVLTPALAAALDAPFYTVAQSVSLFGVIERIEPLLSAAMTMGIFCLLSVQACACDAMGKVLGWGKWTGVGACVAAGGLMFLVKDLPAQGITLGCVIFWVILPLPIVVKTGIRHKV